MNKKHYFLCIVKNISCVQSSSCHTSDENVLALNFSQTTVVGTITRHGLRFEACCRNQPIKTKVAQAIIFTLRVI